MRLVCQNVCGLGKLRRHEDVLALYRDCDALLFQESLQLVPTKLFPGFVVFDVPAVVTGGRNSGGLTVALKGATFGAADLEVVANDSHLLAVLVRWPSFTLLLCSVYAPLHSGQHRDFFAMLYAQLSAIVEIYVPAATVIAGDFNAHLHAVKEPRDRELVEMVSLLSGDEFTTFPTTDLPHTFVSGDSASTIDYVFHRGLSSALCMIDSDISVAQHRPLFVDFTVPPQLAPQLFPAPGSAYWRSKSKQAAFPEAVAQMSPAYLCTTPSTLQAYYDRLSNLISLFTKRSTRRLQADRWASRLPPDDVQRLEEKRATVASLSVRVGNGSLEDRVQLSKEKTELELLTTSLMKKSVDLETDRLVEQAGDHVEAWKVISSLRSTASECPISTDKLVHHFAEIAKPPNCPLLPLPPSSGGPQHMEPLQPEELQEALADTNIASAAGPDGVKPRWLVDTFRSGPAFEFLFNLMAMCLILAFVPQQWREAMMFVLYKGSGDPCDANNYRAIALTSAFGKVYERLLLQRLLKWFKSSRLWSLPQFGFRKASSCAHAIFLLHSLSLDVLSKKKGPVFVAFVDLRKAFPSVGRDALFKRMTDLGIPYPLVMAVRSVYMGNIARLRVDNSLTRDFCVAAGVLEGSVLSPFLFGILFSAIWDMFCTTDFPSPSAVRLYRFDSLWFIAYADDLVVITLSAAKLQDVLNKLAKNLKEFNLQMRC